MTAKVSVILVHARQAADAEGDAGGEALFECARRLKEQLGILHRATRRFFSPEQVDVVQVDPRSQLSLAARLWRDALRYRPGLREGLRLLLQAFALPAVIVNGRVLSRGEPLMDPDALCHHIACLLHLIEEQEAEQQTTRT